MKAPGPERRGEVGEGLVELILESVSDGVFTVDHEFRISYFNRAAERITGYSSSEVLGTRCMEVFRTASCTQDCPMRRSLRLGQRVDGVEIDARTRDGSPLLISVSTAPLVSPEGEFLGGVETFRDHTHLRALRRELVGRCTFEEMVCTSEQMRRVLEALPVLARAEVPVLLRGARGTFKRRMAVAIHHNSPRCEGPLATLCCTGLPEGVLASELVGHVKGATPQAAEDHPGQLMQAVGGTCYIEDLERLSPSLQQQVVRLLREGKVEPRGLGRAVDVDVRLVFGTTRDLGPLVADGRFSGDLYELLKPAELVISDLHQRTEDIPALGLEVLRRMDLRRGRGIRRLANDALAALLAYPFPGNFIELERALEHAYIVSRGPEIRAEDLPLFMTSTPVTSAPAVAQGGRPGRRRQGDTERLRILRCLQRNYWSMSRAAQELGIHRSTLWRKTKQLGINRP